MLAGVFLADLHFELVGDEVTTANRGDVKMEEELRKLRIRNGIIENVRGPGYGFK